ncbi:hypothetical protein V5799_026143 [Amblyomma americanum]|uniref:Uncharacterized protein n=1 Tax=Amblyomma americanum TaxID=6943 RepID=A0AAQ4DJE9_AMBAM
MRRHAPRGHEPNTSSTPCKRFSKVSFFLRMLLLPQLLPQPWRASSVGLLLIASLTMNLVAAPMASLLPFLCMPLLDLADTRAAALPYSTVRQMSFLCAMLLMLTMEECGLSTRLALLILSHTGHKINSILALVIGVAVAMTCLLDAFSVTVLMMSTVECIVDEIYFHIIQANLSTDVYDANRHRCPGSPVTTGSMQPHRTGDSTEHVSYFAYRRNLFNEYGTYVLDERNTLFKAMMAAVVYGSNIGSGGTSRGSQQGYYLLHFLRQTYKEATTLNYFTWTAYSAPSVVASAVFLWWHLCNRWVPRGAVRSETMMVGLTTLVFMVPTRRTRGLHGITGIVSADVIQKRMPWGVFLLAGAGCAMSLCFQIAMGFPVKIVTIVLELVSLVTVGNAMFDLEKLPAWATKMTSLTLPPLNVSTTSILNVTSAA